MRTSLATSVTALTLLALAACGGSSTSTTSDEAVSDVLSKADFISQGDAICAQLTTDTDAVAPPADDSDFGRYIGEVLALASQTGVDFAALSAPEDGVEVQAEMLAALDASISSGEGAIDAAAAGDTVTAGDLLTQASTEGSAGDAAAVSYGFTECGKES